MRIRTLLPALGLVVLAAACARKDEGPSKSAKTAATPAAPAKGDPAEKPHGDHNATHGGVVMMSATMHFEAVPGKDGKHRVYWSDGARDPVPASKLEKVSMTIARPGDAVEELALAKDPSDTFWEGQGKPLAEPKKADITVTFNEAGQPSAALKLVFTEAAPHSHDGEATPGGHNHSAHGAEGAAPTAATLADAVTQLDASYQELGVIVKTGDLSKAHPVADRLTKLGALLPDLATKAGLAAEDVRALTIAGKKLGLLFRDMDTAADAGKRDEAQTAYARYQEPMDTIRAKAALAK